jgi:hypothetical protein
MRDGCKQEWRRGRLVASLVGGGRAWGFVPESGPHGFQGGRRSRSSTKERPIVSDTALACAAKTERPAYARQRESLAKFTTAVSTLLTCLPPLLWWSLSKSTQIAMSCVKTRVLAGLPSPPALVAIPSASLPTRQYSLSAASPRYM